MNPIRKTIILTVKEQQYLILSGTVFNTILGVLMAGQGLGIGLATDDGRIMFNLGLAGLLFLQLQYFVIINLIARHSWLKWMLPGIYGVVASLGFALHGMGYMAVPTAFMITQVALSTILYGRGPTYLFLGLRIAGDFLLSWLTPFDYAYQQMVAMTFIGAALVETIFYLQSILVKQFGRLEMLNHVARRLATSLELDEVLDLIGKAVQESFQADTYYLGLLEGDYLKLALFYDDGEYYYGQTIPLEDTFSGRIIKDKRSLIFYDLPDEAKARGIPVSTIGRDKASSSWMGTPLETGGLLLGVVAVASYQANQFDTKDLNMLENFARQAAMAISNAQQHADAVERSRQDSLTGLYNHGYLLEGMARAINEARVNHQRLGFIMLDVDFFKQYNDTYGHQVGDQVLTCLAQTIRLHVKNTDLVGRWGGEEFAVLLRNVSLAETINVAERIRKTLAEIELRDRDGRLIAPPTVSQGVATYPEDGLDGFRLVDVADRRLYQAKENGRDQIGTPETEAEIAAS
ncbi:MAG TPA: sensor domain-containing diguanylate cyclase [Anaerolineaceae bacterium]|nr:sensor domain-containing diguanylate cyclase [Anaerolineaceae bacterium]HPN53182.1 sensor domain-containing diguanylate cyclase [Anaerolineaceae bacterium]